MLPIKSCLEQIYLDLILTSFCFLSSSFIRIDLASALAALLADNLASA